MVELEPPGPALSCQHSPHQPDTLAAGCLSGQATQPTQHSVTILLPLNVSQVVMRYGEVCCWDLRVGGRPQAVSPFPVSHRGPTCSLIWVASKTGAEFFTASLDGTVGMHSEKYLHMGFCVLYVYPSSTYNDSRFDDPCGKCFIVR